MNDNSANLQNLKLISSILLWCTVFGVAILLLWFVAIVLGLMDIAYSIHSHIGTFSRQQFDVMMYLGLMFWKILVIVFFFIPYVSIQIVLRNHSK